MPATVSDALVQLLNVIVVGGLLWMFLRSKWRTITGFREVWNDCSSDDPVVRRNSRLGLGLGFGLCAVVALWIWLRHLKVL